MHKIYTSVVYVLKQVEGNTVPFIAAYYTYIQAYERQLGFYLSTNTTIYYELLDTRQRYY